MLKSLNLSLKFKFFFKNILKYSKNRTAPFKLAVILTF